MKKQKENKISDDSKLFAFLATFLSIIGFIVAIISKKQDKYVMFYAKQSLIVFITYVIVMVAAAILNILPFIGEVIGSVAKALVVAAWVISWIFALSGKQTEVPLIGRYAKKINL